MAGHSKWANIKFRKAVQDVKRGKIFTKLIREITVSARIGGGEAESNPRLRDAITKALKANMKRDTVDNAIKRGVGGLEGADMMELRYEGYGPNGVAVLVDCLTDNKNRTVSEVRHAFTKFGGNLGTDGSVAYLFNKRGQLIFKPGTDDVKLFELAMEIEAEDVITNDDGSIEVITAVDNFHQVKHFLEQHGFEAALAEVTMQPTTQVVLAKAHAEILFRMIDMLEDLDDVQNVYTNASIADEILAELG